MNVENTTDHTSLFQRKSEVLWCPWQIHLPSYINASMESLTILYAKAMVLLPFRSLTAIRRSGTVWALTAVVWRQGR
jgi:hypothetical protein